MYALQNQTQLQYANSQDTPEHHQLIQKQGASIKLSSIIIFERG